MFDCRVSDKPYPVEGELVVTRTISLEGGILKMGLLEYGNIQGMVLSSELSKRRIRSMHQVAHVGSTEVCQVIRVDQEKAHIDLSLKRPSSIEKQACLDRFAKCKLAYQIMVRVSKAARVTVRELYEAFGYRMMGEYGSLYSFFAKAKNDNRLYEKTSYGPSIRKVIDEQFKAAKYKARVDVDITSPFGGVELIKKAFQVGLEGTEDVETVLLKAPTYSITYVGRDKEEALGLVNRIAEEIGVYITERDGTYSMVEPAKVYGEKHRHLLLDEGEEDVSSSTEESDSDL